jgi:hypothetical protein
MLFIEISLFSFILDKNEECNVYFIKGYEKVSLCR